MVDDLERRVVEVLADGQVDLAAVLEGMAGDQGVVGLLGLAILELPTEFSVGLRVERHDDDAAGVAIEPMDDPGPGVGGRDPAGEAIRLLRTDPGDGEQPRRLVEHDEPVVAVDDGRGCGHVGFPGAGAREG